MHKKLTSFFILITVAVFCAQLPLPCVFAAKQTQYKKIVSLGPAITQALILLRAQDKLTGITTYCAERFKAPKAKIVGTITHPSIESILLLSPDLVLTTQMTPANSVKMLKNMGLKTIEISSPENFDDLCRQFIQIGKLSGTLERAEKIVSAAKKKAEDIRSKTKDLTKPEIIIQIGANPIFVVTQGKLLNDYISFSGGKNAVSPACRGMYSREAVISDNPDIILIATMGIGQQEKTNWEHYSSLNAVKNKRIYILDSYKMCSPTPDIFADMIEVIAKIIHPELTI